MPSHAVHIETLLSTYPDVRIVWAHRDPFKSTASFLRLNYLSRAVLGADVDLEVIVPNVLRQLKEHVDRPLAARRRIGDDRFFDLQYVDLMRDPVAVMRSLNDWAGDDLTASTEQAMRDWLKAHPQDRHGLARPTRSKDPALYARAILGLAMVRQGLTPSWSRPQLDPLPPQRGSDGRMGDVVASSDPGQ